ncbi:MAG: hypothetical protein NTY64_22320, partial [Deltaproteobacteria bacterium]|nr:hypothetical protein [Deltaproteobacteria bacterium]
MRRGISAIIITILLVLIFRSESLGFGNDANFKNPKNRSEGQRDYTRENSLLPTSQGGYPSQGGYYGGHDTITSEAMMLKKEVHSNDANAGREFNLWADREALPNLRSGAHDEDTNKKWDFILNDPPIEDNGWGDYNHHFYNPETKNGLKWIRGASPATERVKDYIKEIQRIQNCRPWGQLSNDERKRINSLFGRIMHLIQDMGNPSHSKDDIHVFNKPFEDYVRNSWDKIVGSDSFQSKVNVGEYERGQYDRFSDFTNPEELIKSLAEISKQYPSEWELNDRVVNQETGEAKWVLNEERLKKNVDDLIPQAVLYSA